MAIVWWDLDGVHALWDEGVDALAVERGYHLKGFPLVEERMTFDFYQGESPEVQEMILDVMNEPHLYKNLRVDPKVKAAFEAVEAAGHTNMFASSPWYSNPTCLQDKSDWVKHIYGDKVRKSLVLTHDKTTLRGDVLIDDKPKLLGLFENDLDFIHVIPTQPYNKDVATDYRINDFEKDLPTLLLWLDNIDEGKRTAR